MMEAGRAWWAILSTENCNHAGAGRIKMNWGHVARVRFAPGLGWEGVDLGGGGAGLEGNTEGVLNRFLLLMNLFA